MVHMKKAGFCLAAFIFSAMLMQSAVAGDWQQNRNQPATEKRHHEIDDPSVQAGLRTPAIRIVQVRPYVSRDTNPGTVYIEVDQATICNSYIYALDMSRGGSKEAYAVALSALILDKPVVFELVNSGCSSSGTKIQSIFLSR
jgi:hypothetical protein